MNNILKMIVFSFLFILLVGSANAEDKSISICCFDWPPHHSPSLKNGGYTAEIIEAIFKPRGYTITKSFLPWKRAQEMAKVGKMCDAITEIYLNQKRLDYFWYGVPYAVHEVYLIALKSHPVKDYTSLKELKNFTFGHNRGGSLSKEFDAADYLSKVVTMGYKNGIRRLLAGRYDFFVSSKSVAFYEAEKLGRRDEIHTIGAPLGIQPVYMAFSKNNTDNVQKLKDYNEGLFLLLKTGRYTEILNKYGF